jgi:hypothetical protein
VTRDKTMAFERRGSGFFAAKNLNFSRKLVDSEQVQKFFRKNKKS